MRFPRSWRVSARRPWSVSRSISQDGALNGMMATADCGVQKRTPGEHAEDEGAIFYRSAARGSPADVRGVLESGGKCGVEVDVEALGPRDPSGVPGVHRRGSHERQGFCQRRVAALEETSLRLLFAGASGCRDLLRARTDGRERDRLQKRGGPGREIGTDQERNQRYVSTSEHFEWPPLVQYGLAGPGCQGKSAWTDRPHWRRETCGLLHLVPDAYIFAGSMERDRGQEAGPTHL
jgi:hypothetical protein